MGVLYIKLIYNAINKMAATAINGINHLTKGFLFLDMNSDSKVFNPFLNLLSSSFSETLFGVSQAQR